MDNQLNLQSGKKLIEKAVDQWEDNGFLDHYGGDGLGQRSGGMGGEAAYDNLKKDPVVNLFMTALAHQTNLLKEQISSIQASLLYEFVKRTVPYTLTRPVPAMTVLRTKMVDGTDSSCMLDESAVIQLEKQTKNKMRFKEQERFSFMPLLKTKILNAAVASVKKTGRNCFEVTISGKSIVDNLSGISLFFPNHAINGLSLSLNGRQLPVRAVRDSEQMPLCDIFDVNHCVFNRSLLYGTTESWMDRMAPLANRFFYIGEYPEANESSSVTLPMAVSCSDDVSLSTEDVLINCVPIVNVEKKEVFLSAEEPIKKIATEKTTDNQDDTELSGASAQNKEKQFLHLLAPKDQAYRPDQVTLRRFGAERYHAGELVAQANALIHRYSSDFYAFKAFADLNIDDRMNQLRRLLNEIGQAVNQSQSAHSGVYVMLQRQIQDYQGSEPSGMTVPYLLTDGQRANGIATDSAIKLPLMLDESESAVLMTTAGGSDEVTDPETIQLTASYYHLSKDRLITKSDIKHFCYKELVVLCGIPKKAVQGIFFQPKVENGRQIMFVNIVLNQDQDQEQDEKLQRAATVLQQKINARTTGFYEYIVRFDQP